MSLKLNELLVTNAIAASITGNAATVTNGVYTTGAQTIAGAKTFSDNLATSAYIVVGGNYTNQAYNSVSSTRLLFGGGDADAVGNYFIGTNLENFGGNYTKLDLRWHTGIRIGAQQTYGGVRIFDSEDLGNILLSIGKGDNHTRVENGYLFVANYINVGASNSENPTIGQIWTQNTSDNYLRKSTPAHFRSQITDGYYPSLTGANASGTWSINITGNAATATTATTANALNTGNSYTVGGLTLSTGASLSHGNYTRRYVAFTSPAANFGNFKQFLRLWPASGSGTNLFTLKVSIRGTWNWTPVYGTLEAIYSLYLPADGTIASTRDFRIVQMAGPAGDNLRIGDAVIENGYVSIPIWVANTNGIEAVIEQWNGSAILGTTTAAVSETLPAVTLTNIKAGLEIQGPLYGSGNVQIRNASPTITFRDTDNRTGYIHVNSNIFYVLTGAADSADGNWGQVANSRWPMEINLSNNNATFGGDVNAISFTGPLTGNATTATTLQTARNINGTSFNGSAAITTATWGTARTITIGSTGKSVDGSGNVSWTLAEIGAAATNQTMFIGTTSVAINRSSAGQTLTGVSIDGNAATVTNGVYTNGNNTFTGTNVQNSPNNTFVNTVTTANQSLTFYQATAGADAYMTFHIGSDFAGYFGLGGAENDLVWGGWSVGNYRYRILHSGNASYAWNMNQNVRTTDTCSFAAVTATTFTGALSGNATSATSATSATFLNSSNYINRCGSSGNANTDFQNTPAGSVRHNGDDANLTNSPGGTWWFYDNYRHSNNSNYWGIQVAWGWEDNANKLATRNITSNSFGGWVYYLNSGNYTDYTVTKTGTGASGTWGINITGNAATATTATNVTIANGSITLAKIENITAYTILGNSNASAAATPAALSVATVATMLSGQTMNIAGSSTSCSGNAATATTATNAIVNSGNTSANWYPIVWHSGNTLYSTAGVTLYAGGSYIQTAYFNSSDDVSTGNISHIVAKFGDNYHRSATAAKVAAFISGQTMNIVGSATSLNTGNTYQVASLGVSVAASNRLHVNGDGTNPAIRVDNTGVVLAATVGSNGRTFYGWLPVSVDGNTRWIRIFS